MNETFKLSIIIPVYNLENYISKCLDSIVKQVDNDIEIVIVDDGSTDKSQEICKKYCDKYKYIKYFYKKNGGVSSARNFGLEKSNGEFVLFVDGDDWLLDNSINLILNELSDKNDIVLSDFVKSFDNKLKKNDNEKKKLLKESINNMKYPNNFINLFKNQLYNLSLWCNVIRKDLFKNNKINFNENLKYTEDMDCMLELLISTKKIYILTEPIYVYRQDRCDSATTKFTLKRVEDTMTFVTKWYKKINQLNINNELREYMLDFVRYQYFIVLGIANLLSKNQKEEIMVDLIKYKFLFSNAYGKKEKIVKLIYKIFGFNITCKLMAFWIKNKSKIYM